jgi:hypothetical protein
MPSSSARCDEGWSLGGVITMMFRMSKLISLSLLPRFHTLRVENVVSGQATVDLFCFSDNFERFRRCF